MSLVFEASLLSATLHLHPAWEPQPLRPLEEIRAGILALEQETEGLLAEIIRGPGPTATHRVQRDGG